MQFTDCGSCTIESQCGFCYSTGVCQPLSLNNTPIYSCSKLALLIDECSAAAKASYNNIQYIEVTKTKTTPAVVFIFLCVINLLIGAIITLVVQFVLKQTKKRENIESEDQTSPVERF